MNVMPDRAPDLCFDLVSPSVTSLLTDSASNIQRLLKLVRQTAALLWNCVGVVLLGAVVLCALGLAAKFLIWLF